MILLPFLYLWLAEPMTFQKEASARDLIFYLGEKHVRLEYQHFTDAADCKLDEASGRSSFPGRGGRPFVALLCNADTPCGKMIELLVFHEPFLGAYITPDPFWESIGIDCAEMLSDEARKRFDDTWQQGG